MDNTSPLSLELNRLAKVTPSDRFDGSIPFAQWQKKAREKLASLLGLPFELCDDQLQILKERQTDQFEEVRFQFQSEEGYLVPCVLRIPKGRKQPLPVFICLQGHSKGMHISLGEPKFPGDEDSIQGGDRDFANRVIEEGYCALTIEQRGMGVRGGDETGPKCHVPAMTSLLLGRTMIAERVWDVSQAITVLEKHFLTAIR